MSRLIDALNALLNMEAKKATEPEVPARIKVVEIHSPLPHLRRFRISAPAGATSVAKITREDGLPRMGDPYPQDALAPAPEPDMICTSVAANTDHTDTECAAIIECRYERAVPVPPPVTPAEGAD